MEYFRVLNTEAQQLNHDFNRLCASYPRWLIGGLGESLRVKSGLFRGVIVVPEASSRGGDNFSLETADHFSICRPENKTSRRFNALTNVLHNIAEHLKEDIRKRDVRALEEARPQNLQRLPEHMEGLDLLLEQVIEKLKKSKILGFVGMGGVGKTTLAKATFNELGCRFEYTCFVRDVKLIVGNERELKEAVWKDMHCNSQKVGGEAEWSKLRGKKLLLIFDDISGSRDVEVLSDIAHDSSAESRFIVTSRDRELLNNLGGVYPIPFLAEDNSQKLFLSHAFPNQAIPPPKLANLVQEIVKKCEGLPLTLEVLGKYLNSTKNYEDWTQTLHALDKAEALQTFDERLWAKLRLSYDGLDKTAQQMFLDVATFFSEGYKWTLGDAMVAWSEAYETKIERLLWKSLVDRSLVYSVKEDEFIRMHEQMRSVGRKIASESSNNGPCRVWEETEALRLLQTTDEVDDKEFHSLWLRERRRYEQGDAIHIAGRALQKLKKVKFLDLGHEVVIDGWMEVEAMPSNLVLLKCSGARILNLALQGRLAVLDLHLVEDLLPSSIGQFSALRIFLLSAERQLALPHEIGHLAKLEIFLLFRCRDLKALPESFGNLLALKILQIQHCYALQALPESFGNLLALKHLQIEHCDALQALPESFGNLSALERLEIHYCSQLQALPESFGNLSALEHLEITDCSELQALPESFGNLSALERLEIYGHSQFQALPEFFGNLSALEHLEINDCFELEALSESFGKLSALEHLEIDGCSKLQALPESFGNLSALKHLQIKCCRSLQALPESFGNLSALKHLHFQIEFCDVLQALPESFGKLSALEHLEINDCSELQALSESFGNLSALEHLEINGCSELQALSESFGNLSALEHLEINGCSKLQALPESFGNLSALKHLQIERCYALQALPESFGNRSALEHLEIDGCSKLQALPESFRNLSALEHLEINGCSELQALPESFGNLSALEHLEINGCSELQALPESFGNLAALEHLEFRRCSKLPALPVSFGQLVKLQYLKISRGQIGKLPGSLPELMALRHLILDCIPIESIPDYIRSMQSLHTVELRILPLVKELPLWLGKSGMAPLGSSHKIFQIQDGHFALTGETRESLKEQIVLLHKRAMEKVRVSDYEEALACLCHTDLEPDKIDELAHWGFLLQERGIVRRCIGDLQGALKDLTAASQVFSKSKSYDGYAYNSWRHRGFVKFLLGDLDSAKEDGTMALRFLFDHGLFHHGCESVFSPSLGEEAVTYMHFRLKGKKEILDERRKERQLESEVLKMVRAGNFTGALAIWEDLDADVSGFHDQVFFLLERGKLKQLVGNFRGALEDLTTALEIDCESYEGYKHRGYVKYLLGDEDGARIDAERCLAMKRPQWIRGFLRSRQVKFLEFNLE